jgi:hypothetical protein
MSSSNSPPVLADELRLDSQNPWPGLTAFTEQQQDYFFGRQDESEELFRCVKRERLTVLFGKSGLGKTSLLQAGLFPQLRAASFLPVYIRLSYLDSAPSLEAQVQVALEAGINSADLAEVAPPQPGETVWEYLHRRGGNLINYEGGVVTPILVFDQFEEWFTLGARKEFANRLSGDFLVSLTDLIENRTPQALTEKLTKNRDLAGRYDFEASGCRILITLREDYLANLENLRGPLPSLVFVDNRMRLTEMNGRQAFSVVAEPSPNLVGSDVAEFIVRFVAGVHADALDGNGGGGQRSAPLPLEQLEIAPAILSLFCRQLNEKRLKQNLPKITRELVSAQGVTIIDDFYKQSIADMHSAVRRLIEDRLLTKAGYRDNIDLAQAKADLEQAGAKSSYIDDLVKLRLLQVEEHRGVPRLELTHDVLADPVKRSRDQWEEQQAREKQLEQEREATAQARRAEQEALGRARYLQKVIGVVTFVSLLLAALLIYAIHERSVAQANEKREKEALNEQVKLIQAKAAVEAEKARVEAENARAEAAEERADAETIKHEGNELKMLRQDEADKERLEKLSKEYLEHCVGASKHFYDMGANDSEVRNLFFHIYEFSLMGPDECFSAAQKIHGVAPENIDITDSLAMIPLKAADTARRRGDEQAVRKYSAAAVDLAGTLQKEKERHGVKILLARTYVLTAYELATIDEEKAKANAEQGRKIFADLRSGSANDFDDRDWDRLSQVHRWYGEFLEVSKKDPEAIQSYEDSFHDLINAHHRKPENKDYEDSALNRAITIGEYEKHVRNNGAAMQWYETGLKLGRECGDRSHMATIYTDMRTLLVDEKKYDEAHALLEERIHALSNVPEDVQRERDLAAAYADAAEVEEARERWPQAIEYRAHSLSALTTLKPDAYEGLQSNLALAYRDLAWAEIYGGQVEKGLADTQTGVSVAAAAKSRSLVDVYADAIKALTTNKRYDQAHQLSEQYIAALEKEPPDVQRDRDLAGAYGRAAAVEEARQQWPQTVDYRAHGLAVLAALKPDAYEGALKDLAIAYRDLARAETYAGQVEQGLADTQKGIESAEQGKDPTTVSLLYTDALSSLIANKSYDKAHQIADQYIEVLRKESQDLPRDRKLKTAYARAAEIEESRKQWPQAVDYRAHEVAVLAAFKPDAYEGARKDLAIAYRDLSWDEIYAGQVDKGVADTRTGIAIAEEMKDRSTEGILYRDAVTSLLSNKHHDDAHQLSDQYIDLLTQEPQGIQRDRDLERAYNGAARLEDDRKDWQKGIEDRKKQVALLTALKQKQAYDDVQKDLAGAEGGLSWAEIEGGRFAEALEDAKNGLAEDPSETWINVNLAHALLLTGNTREARDLYLKIKDYPRGDHTLTVDITDDFQQLCKLGHVRPEMVGIAHDLGIDNAELNKCLSAANAK